ncbi:MAG: hypothetical protein HOJ57_21900 [Lentisphaerae bacterium]|nr:hypothetical protein [Lentisphaerota bacterium]
MRAPDPLALFWDVAQLENPALIHDDFVRMPRATRDALFGLGLLAPHRTAQCVVCDACASGHAEEVEAVTYPTGATHLFIYCPENGRIEVDPDRLRQWTPLYDSIPELIAESLGARGDCRETVPGRLWDIGCAVVAGRPHHVWLARRVTADLTPRLPTDKVSVLFILGTKPRNGVGIAPERVFEVRHLVRLENDALCFDGDVVSVQLAGAAPPTREDGPGSVPFAAIEALHGDVRRIMDHTAPLPAVVAEVASNVDAVLQNTTAIARNEYELRRENAELQELAKGGVLRFATRIDAEDFRAFAAVMLAGNRSKAAQCLGIPQRTFYDRVGSWLARGPDYRRMYRMVEWRKKSLRKIKVRLDDSLLGTEIDGQAENPETIRDVLEAMRDRNDMKSHDDLLRDILQAIADQNADNWQSVQAELIEILEEEVMPQ